MRWVMRILTATPPLCIRWIRSDKSLLVSRFPGRAERTTLRDEPPASREFSAARSRVRPGIEDGSSVRVGLAVGGRCRARSISAQCDRARHRHRRLGARRRPGAGGSCRWADQLPRKLPVRGGRRFGPQSRSGWRSIDRANDVELGPGESLLLERGCVWGGPLEARWQGTEGAPITIGAYGTGRRPIVCDGHDQFVVSGSHLIFQNPYAAAAPPGYDGGCDGHPPGMDARLAFHVGCLVQRRSLVTRPRALHRHLPKPRHTTIGSWTTDSPTTGSRIRIRAPMPEPWVWLAR